MGGESTDVMNYADLPWQTTAADTTISSTDCVSGGPVVVVTHDPIIGHKKWSRVVGAKPWMGADPCGALEVEAKVFPRIGLIMGVVLYAMGMLILFSWLWT